MFVSHRYHALQGNQEREIAALSRKAARKIVARNGAAETVKLEPKDVKSHLGNAKLILESAEKIDEIGVATGLAWTPAGGDILFIEATRMRGRGGLISPARSAM